MLPYGPMMKLSKPKKVFKNIKNYFSEKDTVRPAREKTKLEKFVSLFGTLVLGITAFLTLLVVLYYIFGVSQENLELKSFFRNEMKDDINAQTTGLREIDRLLDNSKKLSYLKFNAYNESVTLKIEDQSLSKVNRPWELYELSNNRYGDVAIIENTLKVNLEDETKQIPSNWIYEVTCQNATDLDESLIRYLELSELEFNEILRYSRSIKHPVFIYPDSTVVKYETPELGIFYLRFSSFDSEQDITYEGFRYER